MPLFRELPRNLRILSITPTEEALFGCPFLIAKLVLGPDWKVPNPKVAGESKKTFC